MDLWISWWNIVALLRPAFSRSRTFSWFSVALVAFSARTDPLGVTSFVRALGLSERCYYSLLNFFHSQGVKLDALNRLWFATILRHFPVVRVGGLPVLVFDGFKNAKEGRKMPGVKYLHQGSGSNAKPLFVMGHSFQVFGVLCQKAGYTFCVPACARIHEGIVRTNRDRRTLMDKAAAMLRDVCGDCDYLLLADAYYANRKMIKSLEGRDSKLVTRVRRTAVAYRPAPTPARRGRGRPRKYGRRVVLQGMFGRGGFVDAPSPVYGEGGVTIRYRTEDLLWKPAGAMVRFVLVDHPARGRIVLLSTDLSLEAPEIIMLYGLRFKIEVGFKQAVHTVGAFGYHFWMSPMRPLKRRNGNQYLHRATRAYREAVERKMRAYHAYVQAGIIAQGLLQYLAMTKDDLVWKSYGSWVRTIRPGVLPSEMIVSAALRNTLHEFLHSRSISVTLSKFILDRIDFRRAESRRFAA